MCAYITERASRFYADTYDACVDDWEGEIAFYTDLAAKNLPGGESLLELACGTGRVAIPIARSGVNVVGLDQSPFMLDVARRKSEGLTNVHWLEGDMRSFQIDESFGLIVIPGHAFQNLVPLQDQVACLASAAQHLSPDGLLVIHLDHQNPAWLGEIEGEKAGVFEVGCEFVHPGTGHTVRTLNAWSYDRASQTATLQTIWDVASDREKVEERIESGPIELHFIFRYEMELLLQQCGFEVEGLYGDFHHSSLTSDSSEMIWIARHHG